MESSNGDRLAVPQMVERSAEAEEMEGGRGTEDEERADCGEVDTDTQVESCTEGEADREGVGIIGDAEEAADSGEVDTPLHLETQEVESSTKQRMVKEESSENEIRDAKTIRVHSPSGRVYFIDASKWPDMRTSEEKMNKDAAAAPPPSGVPADKDEADADLMMPSTINNGNRLPIRKPGTGMVATPANLVMASDPDGCKQLKDMVNADEDATTMVVVLSRPDKEKDEESKPRVDKEDSSANKEEESKPRMDSLLLMALRTGDIDTLVELLTDDDGPHVIIQVHKMGEASGSTGSAVAAGMRSRSTGGEAEQDPSDDPSPSVHGPTTTTATAETGRQCRGIREVDEAADNPASGVATTTTSSSNAGAAMLLKGVTFDCQGDSALHVVAASGDSANYLSCAKEIYDRAKHLLETINNKGDTPVHCAARAGNRNMVTFLIDMMVDEPEREDNGCAANKIQLLRKENNKGETALHCAICSRDTKLIEMLMWEDPELACFPNGKDVTSPLYLAISSGLPLRRLMQLFHGCVVSVSGPHGQNILHIAVWRDVSHGKALQCLFDCCPALEERTEQGDKDGNTPLHFAASMDAWDKSLSTLFLNAVGQHVVYPFWFLRRMPKDGPTTELIDVTQPPGSSLFQPDNEGSYPIHVAAASGCVKAAIVMLERFPSCATLRDGRGRTFLHVAVDKNRWVIVGYAASRYTELASVFNMQDNNGNTALHLAIEIGNEWTFRYLFQIPQVRLDLPNDDGLTAVELAWRKIPARGRFYHLLNPRRMIFRALRIARAAGVFSRVDQLEETYNSEIDEDRLSDNITKGSQVMGILAGLVTSVTFAAAFKLPGGYRSGSGDADAHGNSNSGETPWLAGRYAFDAFIISIALAFICSLLATIGLIYSGFDSIDYSIRKIYFNRSYRLLQSSARSLAVAFGLGIYLVIQPVAHRMAIAVCVIIFGGLVLQNFEIWQSIILINTIRIRLGIRAALRYPTYSHLELTVPLPLYLLVQNFWPLIVTFVVPAPWIYWIVSFIIIVVLSGYF